MLYKGKELKDISRTPQVIVPPRYMLVWDEQQERVGVFPVTPLVVKVLAIVDSKVPNGRVIAEHGSTFLRYGHCADIPKLRVTNRQLSRWLAEGNGEAKHTGIDDALASANYTYVDSRCDEEVPGYMKVRKWGDTDWHEPTLEYMGLEG